MSDQELEDIGLNWAVIPTIIVLTAADWRGSADCFRDGPQTKSTMLAPKCLGVAA
jgi:hypothetical protein